VEEVEPNAKALRLYLSYMFRFPGYLFMSVMFSLALAMQKTIGPLLIALALGQLIHQDIFNTGLLIATGIVYVSLLLLSFLFDWFGVAVLHDRVENKLYQDCFDYLVKQDYSFFTNRFSGSVVTQASRFAKVYTTFNDTLFFDLLPQILGVVGALSVMAYFSPQLALIIFVLWLLCLFLIYKFALQRLPMRRGAVAKESQQVGELADMIGNALTVKTFAAESREMKRYDVINMIRGRLFLASWRRAVRNAWAIEALCVVMQLIVIVGGMLAIKEGRLDIATFLLFQVYILRIIDNISRGVFTARQLEVASGDGQEMTELFEQAPLVQDKPNPEISRVKAGSIAFKNMSFQYDDANQKETLFETFNLDIMAGEKIGLVGPSGGGKTTITRLLLRFMDIQGGSIALDGQDIRDIKQTDLRRAIAYVPQEPLLFHRSIKDNIRYGKPDASDQEVITVAKKAYAHDFISQLPMGYDTLVGERGVKLSGGQRQRVAIARAMLTRAPILVLDEATSALDSHSEQLIQKALWELMKDKTAVVIAHRLSTIQRMDRIVVLDEGRIIEQGSHKELLARKGLYAKLWSHQSGGFLEEED
jgi:ATP-binding cassette, subfamily B, bacterial